MILSVTEARRVSGVENLVVSCVLCILYLCLMYHGPILSCNILKKNMLHKSHFSIAISKAELHINFFFKIPLCLLTCSE